MPHPVEVQNHQQIKFRQQKGDISNAEKGRMGITFNGIKDVWYELRTREEPEVSNASVDWIAVGDDIKAGIYRVTMVVEDKFARWQNLIPSFPWVAPRWRAWGQKPRKGRDQILQRSVAEP